MPTSEVKQVYEVATRIDVQQTNCLYTEYGQRIAYYALPDGTTAFVDIDRGIYAFLAMQASIPVMHKAYLNNQYELWHDIYRIGYQTIIHAKELQYPKVSR